MSRKWQAVYTSNMIFFLVHCKRFGEFVFDQPTLDLR